MEGLNFSELSLNWKDDPFYYNTKAYFYILNLYFITLFKGGSIEKFFLDIMHSKGLDILQGIYLTVHEPSTYKKELVSFNVEKIQDLIPDFFRTLENLKGFCVDFLVT